MCILFWWLLIALYYFSITVNHNHLYYCQTQCYVSYLWPGGDDKLCTGSAPGLLLDLWSNIKLGWIGPIWFPWLQLQWFPPKKLSWRRYEIWKSSENPARVWIIFLGKGVVSSILYTFFTEGFYGRVRCPAGSAGGFPSLHRWQGCWSLWRHCLSPQVDGTQEQPSNIN